MDNKVNVGIDQTDAVVCDECGGIYFQEALHIRKASGFLTGTGQTSYMPIPIFSCLKCGHVNEEFLPKEIKSLD
jgi:uncharacterized Zn finger protein